ncbi:MAG TPA: DUF2325 domain-containing protein [Nitrosospira sp.]|nr:DUF2325 domain-containing protein [Nitrosospira sp.]
MTALLVGGDHIEAFRRELLAHGVKRVEHWDGRRPRFTQRQIPSSAKLVIILCDYVSHSVSNALKRQASKSGIPLVFCRSSTHELRGKLEKMNLSEIPCRRGDTIDYLRNFVRYGFWAKMIFTPYQRKKQEYESKEWARRVGRCAGYDRLSAAAAER